MTRFGIPEYRLPYDTIDRDVDIIRSVGVDIRCNVRIGKDITLAAAPRDVLDRPVGRLGLPPAEAPFMLGYKDDVLGAHGFSDADPGIGVELLGVHRAQWRGEVIGFAALPGLGGDVDEHAHFELVPGELRSGGHGERGGAAGWRGSRHGLRGGCGQCGRGCAGRRGEQTASEME